MEASDDEDRLCYDIFQEPEGFREPEKPATYTEYTMLSGETLRLRLVGHSPLWVLANFNFSSIVRDTDASSYRVTAFGMAAKSYPHISKSTLRS